MTSAAQRLSNLPPARIARLKRLLRLAQAVSPRLASRLALAVFLMPWRRELHPDDAPFVTGARRHLLRAGGSRFHAYEWGSGARTVLIAHGWGSRVSRFSPMASALVARGWRVLAFDAPGHGLSPGRSSSLPQFMAAMDEVATRLGPVHALIGHSLGALAVAARREDSTPAWHASLQKVVLIATPSGAPFLVDAFRSMFDVADSTHQRMQRRFVRRFGAGPDAFVASAASAAMQLPTLLVHDRGDNLVPFAHSEQLLPALPLGRLLATERLGHSELTRDAATIGAIADFLAADSTRAATHVRRASLGDDADARAIVQLLDAYARDPRGGGKPLPQAVQQRLVDGLRATPGSRVWLAFDAGQAVGVCVAFLGYSTFQARPLLNIHDLAVLPAHRGQGIGRALLAAAEQAARAEGCCKLTLEVQEDNAPARQLYDRFGFRDVRYGDSGPTRFLGKPMGTADD